MRFLILASPLVRTVALYVATTVALKTDQIARSSKSASAEGIVKNLQPPISLCGVEKLLALSSDSFTSVIPALEGVEIFADRFNSCDENSNEPGSALNKRGQAFA